MGAVAMLAGACCSWMAVCAVLAADSDSLPEWGFYMVAGVSAPLALAASLSLYFLPATG